MNGHWTINVSDTLSIPTVPFGFVKSRAVTDSDTGHIVETFLASPTTKPEQVHRNVKKYRNVHVVLEVYEKRRAKSLSIGRTRPWLPTSKLDIEP